MSCPNCVCSVGVAAYLPWTGEADYMRRSEPATLRPAGGRGRGQGPVVAAAAKQAHAQVLDGR